MKLDFVDTTAAHIYDIVSDLSEVTAAEIRNGRTSSWNLMRDLCQLLPTSRAVTLRVDGDPVFVFGHSPSDTKNRRMTWFIAKPRYFALGARGVLVARNYLRQVKATWPNTKFESYSFSDHPGCERWFKLLGFSRSWPLGIPEHCRVFTFDTERKR